MGNTPKLVKKKTLPSINKNQKHLTPPESEDKSGMTMNEVDDMTSEDLDRLSVSVNEKNNAP